MQGLVCSPADKHRVLDAKVARLLQQRKLPWENLSKKARTGFTRKLNIDAWQSLWVNSSLQRAEGTGALLACKVHHVECLREGNEEPMQ